MCRTNQGKRFVPLSGPWCNGSTRVWQTRDLSSILSGSRGVMVQREDAGFACLRWEFDSPSFQRGA